MLNVEGNRMATPVLDRPLTKDEVLSLPDDNLYELVEGRLEELNVSWETSAIAIEISSVVRNFVRPGRLGVVSGADNTLDIFDDPDHFRRADVSFTLAGRIPEGRPGDGSQEIAPDLVVEVVSPNDRVALLEKKIQEYLDAGATLIWVVFPSLRSVDVIRRGRPRQRLGPEDLLDGEDVLPGFSYPVADIFDI